MMIISAFGGFSQFSVKPQSVDSYEPNNSEAQATVIHISETQTHSIDPANDVDYFQIVVNKSQFVNVVLTTTGYLNINGLYALSQIKFGLGGQTTSFEVYLNPDQKNIFSISGSQIVSSYSVSVNSNGYITEKSNHFSNSSYGIQLNSDVADVLNYTNSYESDWYTFNISTPTTIRAILGITPLPGFDIVKMELFNENLTELDISYRTVLTSTFEATVLAKLEAGTYYLKITTTQTSNVGIFIYDLTLTTNISSLQHVEIHEHGTHFRLNNTKGVGVTDYIIDGTVVPNTPLIINLDPWALGTFHTGLTTWNNNYVTYTIGGTPIVNSNTSEISFTTAQQLQLSFNSSIYADFQLIIARYGSDYYDQSSSQQNPFELHRIGAGRTYSFGDNFDYFNYGDPTISYPYEVDWWQFTPPVSGQLNVTFNASVKLNVTVYNYNGTVSSITPDMVGNTTTFDFGDINSTIIFSVSLFNPQDLATSYHITVTYIDDYVPLILTSKTHSEGNSSSRSPRYLIELGLIFVAAIVIMIIIQQKIKNRPKNGLD